MRVVWRFHPAAKEPHKAVFALMVCALFILLVWQQWPSLLLVAVCALVFILALGRFFFPNRYLLDDEGVRVDWFIGGRRLRWEEVKRARFMEDGVFLSPLEKPGIRDSFVGLFIHYGRMRDEVEPLIRERVGVEKSG